MLLKLDWEAHETVPILILEYNMQWKLYWEAQETVPATYPRIQYAIEAVLGSTGDGPCYLS